MPPKRSPAQGTTNQSYWAAIIASVTTPLGFFALVVLTVEAAIGILALNLSGSGQIFLIGGALLILLLAVLIVAYLAKTDKFPRKVEYGAAHAYSVSFRPGKELLEFDLTEIAWDKSKCFVNYKGTKELVVPAVGTVAPILEIRLPPEIFIKISEYDPLDIELVDMKGHKWESGSFYIYQTQVKLSCTSNLSAMLGDYGGGA